MPLPAWRSRSGKAHIRIGRYEPADPQHVTGFGHGHESL
jgi:hypothetical protein